jgi:hypothetical protein
VNKRATTWLLAALIALCSAHAAPPVRVQRAPQNCAIVWIARARLEQRVSVERRGEYQRASLFVFRLEERNHANRPFSKSLYQRPPPLSFLSA